MDRGRRRPILLGQKVLSITTRESAPPVPCGLTDSIGRREIDQSTCIGRTITTFSGTLARGVLSARGGGRTYAAPARRRNRP
jgi:hypothetical protein